MEGKIVKIRRCAVNGIVHYDVYNGSDIGFNELWIHVSDLTVADVWNVKVGDKVEVTWK